MLSRRLVIAGVPASLVLGLGAGGAAVIPAWRDGDPFSLGVASGCSRSDGFVIWTRLAPDPLCADPTRPGGLASGDMLVRFTVATDESMRHIVQRGEAKAEARFAHSVHHRVRGLDQARPYWYQFSCGSAQSRIGRASTFAPSGAHLDRLKFGFVSCSNYEHGYFSAYKHLADEHPDFVAYLGDYIYEYVERRRPTVRTHSDGVEASTLPTYRNRYAQYRLDENLQRLHATAPALITWDDHEVQNDYADQWSQTFDAPEQFLLRRAAAYQAFYEHMPVDPLVSTPRGSTMRVYDKFSFGDLAQFHLIDGRQYRTREACYGPPDHGGGHVVMDAACPERLDPARSMIGLDQEAWLFDSLAHSRARWNILAQDVMMAQLRERQPDGEVGYWTDDWNGYPSSRSRLLQHMANAGVSNPVVLTGDIHSFWANDLKLNFNDANSPAIATELVGTSISAPGPDFTQFSRYLADNPHVKFFDSRKRGYVSADITADRIESRFQIVSDAADPNATVSTLCAFALENGRPGVQTA
jgi:alkaline phosphatase D